MFRRTRKSLKRVILILFFCLGTQHFAFAATKPTVGSITPAKGSTGPDTAVTFTATYSDADGWKNLKEAYLLISTNSSLLSNSVYLYYDQNENKLYLRDDGNKSWLGGFAPKSKNVIENSQVKLNCALTTVSGSGKAMKVKWNLTFKAAYAGKVYYTCLKIVDDTSRYLSWIERGTFCVFRQPVSPPK